MTVTSSGRNSYGIFYTKRAFILAKKYSLNLHDKNAYITHLSLVKFNDVKFIVDNLWLDHFMYGTNKPIDLPYNEYWNLFYSLQLNYPQLLNYSTS